MSLTAKELMSRVQQNGRTYQYMESNVISKVDPKVRQVSDDTKALRKSIRKLSGYDKHSSTKTTVEKQLLKFTDEFNTMMKNEGKVDDKTYKKNFTKLKELVEKNKYQLKKIGFEYSDDKKKYIVDKEKFDKASDKELAKIFSDENSFMIQADQLVKKMHKSAISNTNLVIHDTHIKNASFSGEQMSTAQQALNSRTILAYLKTLSGAEELDDEYIDGCCYDYTEIVNRIRNCEPNEEEKKLLTEYMDLFETYKSDFEKVGFSFDPDASFSYLNYDKQDWENASEEQKNTLKSLFDGGEDSFGAKADAISKKIFKTVMRLEKTGIAIDEYT